MPSRTPRVRSSTAERRWADDVGDLLVGGVLGAAGYGLLILTAAAGALSLLGGLGGRGRRGRDRAGGAPGRGARRRVHPRRAAAADVHRRGAARRDHRPPCRPRPARLFITEKAVSKHIHSVFTKLTLPPSDDDHRRVLAVLTYLNGTSGTAG